MFMDFHPNERSLYIADFWGFSCSRGAGWEKGHSGDCGICPAGRDRDSGVCRIYRRYRDYT